MHHLATKPLLGNDNCPAILLNCLMINAFGGAWYAWEPETIWKEIEETFSVPSPSSFISDKIMAVSVLLGTDQFYNRYEAFENIGQAFNHNMVYFDKLTPLEPMEIAWALCEAQLLDDTPRSFSDDVKAYIKASLRLDGFVIAPEIIRHLSGVRIVSEHEQDVDRSAQEEKHLVVHDFCVEKLREVNRLTREYFNKDIAKQIKDELGLEV